MAAQGFADRPSRRKPGQIALDRAVAAYELMEPRFVRKPWWLLILHVSSGSALFNPQGVYPDTIHEVCSRSTGQIVYSAKTKASSNIASEETRRMTSSDLARLNRAEFDRQYGILDT
jgi:hypothetical protein